MANFAIAADENVIARGNKLIEELQEPGEKKGVTLNRLFDLVSTHLQEDQLKRSGVDTEALDASITNIRNLFTAALSGKEEIRAEYERRIAELRESNEESEKNYKIQLGKLASEKEDALRKYTDLKELQETAETARKAAEEQAASAVNLVKEKEKTKDAADLARRARAAVRKGLGAIDEAVDPVVAMSVENDGYVLPRELKKGDTVLIADLGKEATVLSPVDRNGNVEVLAGAAKTRVKLKNLRLIENAPKKRSPNSGARRTGVESKMNMDASARLDVRGLTVDDCIMELDRYIDYMLRMGLGEFTIVHGKGTGALRSAVNQYLRKSPYVKSFRLGVYGEGEDGVTIVVLK